MQHTALAGGPKAMEVDHFDPTLEGEERNEYSNLLLATRHCNLAKGDRWPDEEDRAAGIRFLNPCEEQDYGVHLLEDPVTHELVGTTPTGRWHIDVLLLNAPHLVDERRRRAEMKRRRKRILQLVSVLEGHVGQGRLQSIRSLVDAVEKYRTEEELMIPEIPVTDR